MVSLRRTRLSEASGPIQKCHQGHYVPKQRGSSVGDSALTVGSPGAPRPAAPSPWEPTCLSRDPQLLAIAEGTVAPTGRVQPLLHAVVNHAELQLRVGRKRGSHCQTRVVTATVLGMPRAGGRTDPSRMGRNMSALDSQLDPGRKAALFS